MGSNWSGCFGKYAVNAIDRLLLLADYWDRTRQVGHTSVMMNGVLSTRDCIVIAANRMEGRAVEEAGRLAAGEARRLKNMITVNDLTSRRLAGHNAPLIVDHHAMSIMIRNAVAEMKLANAT